MKFVVDPVFAWPLVALVGAALVALVLVTYPPRVRHLPRWTRRSLLGLRLLAAVLLALAMLRPSVQFTEKDADSALLIVLADASRSMTTPDGPGGVSRREAMLKAIEENAPALEAFSDEVDLLRFDYAERLAAVKEDADFEPTAEGERTAIGRVLDQLLEETRSRRVVGVVLMGDGAARPLSQNDPDPRTVADRYAELGVPIYTVGFGGSGIGESTLDLAVEELQVNPVEFEKKVVVVRAQVRALGAAGRPMQVRLLVEDRRGVGFGEEGEMKQPDATQNAQPVLRVTPEENEQTIPVELSFVAETPGEFKLGVEIEPIDGELKTSNNRRETIITVRRGGIRIAYFDKLRPEMHYLKRVNTEENVQLDFRLIRYQPEVTEIEPEFFEPGRYDAYIVGDVPAAAFGRDGLRALAARVGEGAGLLMTGGFYTFGPGGYAGTPLEPLLPVALRGRTLDPGDPIPEELHRLEPLPMLPTRRGSQSYVMRLDVPARNEDHWRELPPLKGANLLQPAHEAVEVFAETPEGVPLLFHQELRPARVLVLAADTTYVWLLHGFEEEHQRFWRQMILYLSRKETEGDELVWARVDPRNYLPEQRVEPRFGAQTEEGQPLPDATFDVTVTDPEGEEHELEPRKREQAAAADFLQTAEPGDYWVQVRARIDGELHGLGATTRFIVDARDPELDNPAADPGLLEEIAVRTGGSMVAPEELGNRLGRLQEEGLAERSIENVRRITLWDNWPFLVTFVGVMSLEWLIRKRRGLV